MLIYRLSDIGFLAIFSGDIQCLRRGRYALKEISGGHKRSDSLELLFLEIGFPQIISLLCIGLVPLLLIWGHTFLALTVLSSAVCLKTLLEARMGILEKLEVPHAPGLTYSQLFLTVSSTKFSVCWSF